MRQSFINRHQKGSLLPEDKPGSANDKLLDVLDAFGTVGPHLSFSDLVKSTGLPKATLFRILRLAERRGYVQAVDGSDKYMAGLPLLVLGHQALAGSRVRSLGMPLLIRLSEVFDLAAHLAVPYWPHILYLERVGPPRLYATFSRPGRLAPFYATATGKVLAAFQPPDAVEDLLRRPRVALTERTKVDADVLRADLRGIRGRGWALDDGEMRVGVRCLAAPVRDESGSVAAAIGVSTTGPEALDDPPRLRALLDAANTLSGLLGYA